RILTDEVSTERPTAGEQRQAAVLCERRGADNGVVTPELAAFALPPRGADVHAAHAVPMTELGQARKESRHHRADGRGLHDSHMPMARHDAYQQQDGRPIHDAVGVEQDEEGISPSPAFAKVAHVARFVSNVGGPATVDDATTAPSPRLPRRYGGFLRCNDVG